MAQVALHTNKLEMAAGNQALYLKNIMSNNILIIGHLDDTGINASTIPHMWY